MSAILGAFVDNPIIVKHVRSRLRTSQVVPRIIVILCICGIQTYTGQVLGGMAGGVIFYVLSVIAGLVLITGGANQVAMTIGSAKESGILDFHRVSPLPASTVTIGFLLGAPIREYVYFAVFVPFMLIAGSLGGLAFIDYINVFVPLLMTAWLIHSLAILSALVSKKPKMASVGIVALTILTCWIGSSVLIAMAEAGRANGQPLDLSTFRFFGVPIPRVLFISLYEGAATIFLLIAATRKMRADRAYSFAKWEALVCMATVVALVLGAFWSAEGIPLIVVGLLYVFVVAGIILCNTITPNLGDYLKGVRRARRLGHRRAPILSDSASNMWAVLGLSAWVLIGATIAWEGIESRVAANPAIVGPNFVPNGRLVYSQTIAVGVLTVAYYGLAKQFFALKYGRKGETFFRLFLFMVWIMPLLIGWAMGITGAEMRASLMAVGISPWAGISLSINAPGMNNNIASEVRFMALLPSVAFAIVFQFMLLMEQRRIDLGLASSSDQPVEKRPLMI